MMRWTSLGMLVAVSGLLAGCYPWIYRTGLEPSAEGSLKDASAGVLTKTCSWRAPSQVRYRRTGSTAWIDLPRPNMTSGEIALLRTSGWRTPIAGSDAFVQGETFEVEWTIPYWGSAWLGCPPASNPGEVVERATLSITRPFAVNASGIELAANGTAVLPVTITRYGAFTAPVTLAVSGLPANLTASPSSQVVSGTSATFTLSANASAAAGTSNASLDGTSPPRTAQHDGFSVSVTRPTLASVSPSKAPAGTPITASGARFDPSCANNYLTIAGINVPASSCSVTTVTAAVPSTAPIGPTEVTVTANGVSTAPASFSVGRQPGAFVEIGDAIRGNTTSGSCASGEVSMTISGTSTATASYRRNATGSNVGSIAFQRDSAGMEPYYGGTTYTWSGSGGAGFSLCSTGVALDPVVTPGSDEMAYRFLRLDDGTSFSKTFHYFTAVVTDSTGTKSFSSPTPDLYRSPDGTVFVAVVPSQVAVAEKALVIDRRTGSTLGAIEFNGLGGTVTAELTSANNVVVTRNGTSFPAVAVP